MATYSVLYLNDDGFEHRFTSKSVDFNKYHLVADIEAETPDAVFRAMNAVDGTELCCRLGVRSMSVGDLLVRTDTPTLEGLLCASCGWEAVQVNPV